MAWHAPITWTTDTPFSVAFANFFLKDDLDYLKTHTDAADAHAAQHAAGGSMVLKLTHQIPWYIPGTLATGANQSVEFVYRGPAGTIIRADAMVKTAPTGADLIFDISKNGASIWAATPANRVKIVATATSGTQTVFDTTALGDGDIVRVDIDQVGAVIAGADASVTLVLTRAPEVA